MLFSSKTTAIADSAYRQALRDAQTQRKQSTALKLDLYSNALVDHVLEQIRRTYKTPENIAPVSVNILRKIVNRLASVYLQDATRTIDGTEQDKNIYATIEDSAALPVRMKQANRLAKLTGNALLRPVWRNGAMALDILTGDILDVHTGDSPEALTAVIITHYPQNGRADAITYSLWTPLEFQRLDHNGRTIATEPNPYGVLPFVPVWSQSPTDSFWLPGAEDLALLQNAINERLTDLCYTLRFQSFGVGYIKGGKAKATGPGITTLEAGPNAMLLLPDEAAVGFASPDAPVEACLEAIDRLMKWAAVSNGLPASSMSLTPTEESGLSKLVSNSELEEYRRDDIAAFARTEAQLFNLCRTVWNAHNPTQQLSEAATITIDFYDPKPTVTASEQLKEWQGMMELGLLSPVDVLIEKNPDLTRDMAKAKLLQIRDELAEFGQNLLV